jgi:hypothetical protein
MAKGKTMEMPAVGHLENRRTTSQRLLRQGCEWDILIYFTIESRDARNGPHRILDYSVSTDSAARIGLRTE